MRVLLIDNHDSFSAILHHYLWELTGVRPLFHRNDELTREGLRSLEFDAAVFSPGPGHPSTRRDFGICRDVLELYPNLPVLGVCLGHQGLADFAGGKVVPLSGARHGRASPIRHDGKGLFIGLPQGFQAVRYHSLVVDAKSLPPIVEVTAWSEDDDQVMGLRFTDRPWFGVQFHPESIGSEQGKALLANFLNLAKPSRVHSPFPKVSDSPETVEGASVHYRELSWKDPETVFVRHFAKAQIAFWLDGSPPEGAGLPRPFGETGWPETFMGIANSLVEFDDLISFRAWYDALNLKTPKQAPWPGYRGGPLGQFNYEGQSRWMIPDAYLIFDHREGRVFAAWEGNVPPVRLQTIIDDWEKFGSEPERVEDFLLPFEHWKPLLSKEEYLSRVLRIQDSIAAGETYEACLTHAFSTEADADPLAIFLRLRKKNPAPYAAFLALPELHLLSVSPELFLELSSDGVLRSRPIKGTRPRGKTLLEDTALKINLATHPKDRAENLMIVDLTRHDFSRVCALGSVEAPVLMEVETHPAVFQLVSEVRGRLEGQRHPLEAVMSCLPGGSMTGAPKERTIELLAKLEGEPRGVFSGALGYFTQGGAFTLSMVIRTLENHGQNWKVGCGGAVLADSDPEAEWHEATLKARSVIDAAA